MLPWITILLLRQVLRGCRDLRAIHFHEEKLSFTKKVREDDRKNDYKTLGRLIGVSKSWVGPFYPFFTSQVSLSQNDQFVMIMG
jgi:hypothetical protein